MKCGVRIIGLSLVDAPTLIAEKEEIAHTVLAEESERR